MPKRLIPITELDTLPDPIGLDVGSLAFPVGLDVSNIGVYPHSLKRAASLIGVSFLKVSGYSGEENKFSVSGKLNADGSIVGGISSSIRAEDATHSSDGIDGDLKDAYAEIKINTAARNTTVISTADLYNPQIQAQMLDRTVRAELLKLAVAVNSNRGELPDRIIDIGTISGLAVQGTLLVEPDNVLQSMNDLSSVWLVGSGAYALTAYGIRAIKARSSSLEPHHSLFGDVKADRIALAAGYITSHRFFKIIRNPVSQ